MVRQKPDYWLIFITFLLVAYGLVMVFSTSYYKGIIDHNDAYFYFTKQLIAAMIGIFCFFVVSNIPYHWYRKHIGKFLLLSFILLIGVLLFGSRLNGAQRWLEIGGISFQPSELLKMTMILYTASIMVKKQPVIQQFHRSVLPPIIIITLVCFLLIKQPHFSVTIIILSCSLLIMFVAGIPGRYFGLLALMGIPILLGILYMEDYRVARLSIDPFSDPLGKGMQTIYSLIAIGPGGITGVGIGNSMQKLAYLPEAHNDFIFSVLAEELGFLGGSFLIFLFIAFLYRGMRIAVQAPDQFGTLVSVGIISLFCIQVILNLSVVTALIPVTGVPLPLISYGGTSLVIHLIMLGILLNISRHRIKPGKKSKEELDQQGVST